MQGSLCNSGVWGGNVWDGKMTSGLKTLLIMMLLANGARAEDAQTDLAHQIRQESTSTGEYVGAETQFYLDITECKASSEMAQKTSGGTRIFGYRFDLGQTRLPEIPPKTARDWGVRDVGENLPMGEVRMTFTGSHEAQVYGETIYAFEEWGPFGGILFPLPSLTDLDRPLRLLKLLHRYQSQFCLNSG